MNTSHGRVCSQLSGIVQQLPANPNAFWRQAAMLPQTSSARRGDYNGSTSQSSAIQNAAMTITSGKECTLQLVEKLDGIVGADGQFLTSDLSSELQCYTTLQSSDHKVACKVRLSPKFDLEHVQEHP